MPIIRLQTFPFVQARASSHKSPKQSRLLTKVMRCLHDQGGVRHSEREATRRRECGESGLCLCDMWPNTCCRGLYSFRDLAHRQAAGMAKTVFAGACLGRSQGQYHCVWVWRYYPRFWAGWDHAQVSVPRTARRGTVLFARYIPVRRWMRITVRRIGASKFYQRCQYGCDGWVK
jgi:hypothetical protein